MQAENVIGAVQGAPFTPLPNYIVASHILDATEKAIFNLLAMLRNADEIRLSEKRIAEDAQCCPKTVRNKLKSMIAKGVVRIEARFGPKGEQETNAYYLDFSPEKWAEKKPPADLAEDKRIKKEAAANARQDLAAATIETENADPVQDNALPCLASNTKAGREKSQEAISEKEEIAEAVTSAYRAIKGAELKPKEARKIAADAIEQCREKRPEATTADVIAALCTILERSKIIGIPHSFFHASLRRMSPEEIVPAVHAEAAQVSQQRAPARRSSQTKQKSTQPSQMRELSYFRELPPNYSEDALLAAQIADDGPADPEIEREIREKSAQTGGAL